MIKSSAFIFTLFNYIRPNMFVNHIDDINPYLLKKIGIKYVFCDLDNTLVPHFTTMPTKSAINFVDKLHEQGIKVIIVSNNSKKRLQKFCLHFNADDFVYNAKKPALSKIKKIIKKYKIDLDDSLILGDQFISDIWTANRLGIKSILVLPIIESNKLTTNNIFINLLEKYIYKKIQHENLLSNITNKLEENYEIL